MYFRAYLLCMFIFCCIFYAENVSAQNCLNDILLSNLYSGSDNIINGKKWIYEKKYSGTPLLTEEYWPEATISYKGVVYKEVLMNFDIVKNEIIIYLPEKGKEKYVVLCTDYLSEFSFSDSLMNRDRFFEFKELPGIDGKALYENASSGKISFYIKPVKNIVVGSSGKGRGAYQSLYEYYISTGIGYSGFRSKNSLIKYLGNSGSEAKRFIKKNNIKINNQHPEGIIAVINYINGLN